MEALKTAIDKGEKVLLVKSANVHDICGLIKLYLKELPGSLFPENVYDQMMTLMGSFPSSFLSSFFFL